MVLFWSPEKFRVLTVTYRDHREGPGGPPGGATGPRGLRGPTVGGDQPQVGWCTPHKGPRCLGFGEGLPPPYLGGKFPPLPPLAATLDGFGAAAPLGVGTLEGAHPLPLPYIYLRFWGCHTQEFPPLPGAALPLSLLVSCGAWRSPAGVPRSSTTTTPSCCCWMESSPTSPSPLAGSRRRRRHRAVRVLNTEVPFVWH